MEDGPIIPRSLPLNTAFFWAMCELALSWWRMMLLSGLIFRSSVMTFGKQMVVYQSAVTVICSLRGIVAI
ncbi:unnamed protein product [Acanthoscelides obtectus]|uniref:Uncharacterized protein n=1 Tax=Acanthoscelides obtectus TaxID=200917 RepID=A0A9P0JGP1_ACAOB|nr:unnamed protein product [Acanthoscelides obtectus]CAK1661595.1 hypothetical protein AOBTE_LOCUS22709 [Acanthoscelides obtectus]